MATVKERKRLTWPPKVGTRFCLDYGPGNLDAEAVFFEGPLPRASSRPRRLGRAL